ncbi:aspartate/glutamate racemase family protein [Anaerotardibacter muris]|uniref:aspartate/glutamate racemase family protein n=1 Tax=Anaerotardibacter muris TaxID=2941505 RepID=UPI00203DB068|nr:aspartate/glutamate racemase family protein [Anaerotardibacter muris]
MTWQKALTTSAHLDETFAVPAHYTSGHAIGVIAIDLKYPKLPGNVVNATTYDFPVLYKKVEFEIELLFQGAAELEDIVIAAAKELEAEGVRAIVGACGYFVHFQDKVAAAVDVPVYISSLCQLPIIKLGLKPNQKIAVFAASADDINDSVLAQVGASMDDIVLQDVGSMESFAPIRWGKNELDNGKLTADLAALAKQVATDHPEVGALLLECSDLPPYAYAMQAATGLPVYDFITMINWAHSALVQTPYYGYF